MNIAMSYLDHRSAGIEQREAFSYTKSAMAELYTEICGLPEVQGAVILSTCNRTELYLSLADEINEEPYEVLCRAAGKDPEQYAGCFETLYGQEALLHLCELSSGMLSQIWGEDQIITQVKEAIVFARENKAADSILEVLFRTAVTAGKRVRTEVAFRRDNSSSAECALRLVQARWKTGKVLVIGNGVMGRLAAEYLRDGGYEVTMTLRQYKYRQNLAPEGVGTVEYEERYRAMEGCCAVVSATVSPHHTVALELFRQVKEKPSLLIDLAVPRDIDPQVAELPGVECYNIDMLGDDAKDARREEINAQALRIVEKYMADFSKWYHYKMKAAVAR